MAKLSTATPLVALALIGTSTAALPSPSTNTVPTGQVGNRSQSVDLTRYFPTRGAAVGEFETVRRAEAALKPEAGADVTSWLRGADELLGRARRLEAYFTLLKARDVDDLPAHAAVDAISAIEDNIRTKARAVLRPQSAATLASSPRSSGLARYALLKANADAQLEHELPAGVSAILDATSRPAFDGLWTTYQKVGRLPMSAPSALQASATPPNRETREKAWRERWAVLRTKSDVNASILFTIVRLRAESARLRKFRDAIEAGYADRSLEYPMVTSTLAAVRGNAALYQTYHRLRAHQLTANAGISDARPWDLSLLGVSGSHFSLEDVRRIAPMAVSPLGADYAGHFSELLAPAGGRLDIAAVDGNREAGGFSINAPGVPSALYVSSFNGTLGDLRKIVHEGGHAVAAQFANEGGTSSFFERGPEWLMESHAILAEFLLYDYLARTAATPSERRAYLSALVDDMVFQVFGSAEEATLEQSIYQEVAAGRAQSAGDLDNVTLAVMKDFEPWPDDILRTSSSLWSTKRLFFQDPFYLVNYLFAGMIAINLYRECKEHPDTFPVRYRELLRRGYDKAPAELLKPLLGARSEGAPLTEGALSVIRSKLLELSRASASLK